MPQGHAEALGHTAAFEDQNLRRIGFCQLVERGAHTLLPRVKGESKGGFRLPPPGWGVVLLSLCGWFFTATVRPLVKKKSHGKRMPTGKRLLPPPLPAPYGGSEAEESRMSRLT